LTILIAIVLFAAILLAVLMLSRRSLSLHRAVLLHTPAPLAWKHIEDFPQLLAVHGRGRAFNAFGRHDFVKGDPGSSGSVWRSSGTWEGADYWFEAEIVRVEPGRQIVVRLLRDSLHTHHGLQGHVAKLTLKSNGSGTSKLTWNLHARFRPARLLWQRHCDRLRLDARLLDICLRSVKVAIDNGSVDVPATGAGQATDDGEPEERFRPEVPTPPPSGSGGPPLHAR